MSWGGAPTSQMEMWGWLLWDPHPATLPNFVYDARPPPGNISQNLLGGAGAEEAAWAGPHGMLRICQFLSHLPGSEDRRIGASHPCLARRDPTLMEDATEARRDTR